ncbi:hypothetical protein ABET51_06800 [Metabacillus fastidiosus]|uniref:hypothetical protein n=1 Tax=Metabacillus fastidiosus TaxID=1458 RepID=UPI003D29D91D
MNMANNIITPYLNYSKLSDTFLKISKGFKETNEDLKRFKTAIVDLGYPPYNDIGIKQLRYISQEYRDRGKEHVEKYIDEFMTRYFHEKRLQAIALNWEKNKTIKKRLPILRSAIKAHNLKMFEVVAPTLIPQFEGMIVDAFMIKGRVGGVILQILLKHLLLENEEFQSELSFDDAMHDYYKDHILTQFDHGDEIESDVSRNAILHGGDTDFGKETVSLKVILLCDYLLDTFQNLKEETIVNAQKEVEKYREDIEKRKRNNRRRKEIVN